MVNTENTSAAINNRTVSEVAQFMTYTLNLTESQVENLVEFFQFKFIDMIREDEEIDNIEYIADMMEIYKGLKRCEHDIMECKKFNCPVKDDDGSTCSSVQRSYNPNEIVTAF